MDTKIFLSSFITKVADEVDLAALQEKLLGTPEGVLLLSSLGGGATGALAGAALSPEDAPAWPYVVGGGSVGVAGGTALGHVLARELLKSSAEAGMSQSQKSVAMPTQRKAKPVKKQLAVDPRNFFFGGQGGSGRQFGGTTQARPGVGILQGAPAPDQMAEQNMRNRSLNFGSGPQGVT